MATIPNFDPSVVESIAKILGDTTEGFTGTEIDSLLAECGIDDPGFNTTKWRKLNDAMATKQQRDRCANNLVALIQHAMNPARHLKRADWFAATKYQLNQVLSFETLYLHEDGVIRAAESRASTINEAAARASILRDHLVARKVHADVLKFCREELLVDNYFHAVFEATKSVAEKIRRKTGLTSDGAKLVDEAFKFRDVVPHLALSSLQTEGEQSEQAGFTNLLRGLFGTFRNTTAHIPKVVWRIEEQDALDILSLVSLIHRRLDKAVEARKQYAGVGP